MASVVYLGLSQLGNPSPSTSRISQKTSSIFADDANIDRIADKAGDIVSVLDGVFTPAAAIRFLTLQTVLVRI